MVIRITEIDCYLQKKYRKKQQKWRQKKIFTLAMPRVASNIWHGQDLGLIFLFGMNTKNWDKSCVGQMKKNLRHIFTSLFVGMQGKILMLNLWCLLRNSFAHPLYTGPLYCSCYIRNSCWLAPSAPGPYKYWTCLLKFITLMISRDPLQIIGNFVKDLLSLNSKPT